MKAPTSQTAEVSARDMANSTLTTPESQSLTGLAADDQESLLILGDVAGRYIAAHLYKCRSASLNVDRPGAL
jgi:hypothetical protein